MLSHWHVRNWGYDRILSQFCTSTCTHGTLEFGKDQAESTWAFMGLMVDWIATQNVLIAFGGPLLWFWRTTLFFLCRLILCVNYTILNIIASYSSTSCSKNKIISLSSVPSPRTFVVQNIPPLFPRTFVAIVLPSFFFTRHISFRWNDVLTKTLLYWYFIDAVENCSYRQVICNKNITISISCNKSYALVD